MDQDPSDLNMWLKVDTRLHGAAAEAEADQVGGAQQGWPVFLCLGAGRALPRHSRNPSLPVDLQPRAWPRSPSCAHKGLPCWQCIARRRLLLLLLLQTAPARPRSLLPGGTGGLGWADTSRT
jgi:hypothetical protein